MDKLGQEWVSAAVDGETDEQTLAELAADEGSHQQWRDYHMIGDAMRGELAKSINLDLSASIAAAIDKEPTIIAPVNKPSVSKQGQNNQTGFANVIPMFKQFGQYAIAASVALVAVVGVQNYNQEASIDSAPLSVLNTRPLVGSVTPVSLQTGPIQQNQSFTNDQVMEQRQRVNAYIQDHMLQQRLNNGPKIEDNSVVDSIPVSQ
ncbi:anti-sigma factor [Shewanella eurypsychrophilus]|uniref:Anti-sigma-E factor RseA n=1 Tax=Shewanella eurypsychrophilus TaxID=2593656 RepID=A0ABX6V318_9GAMM|nr:MULTISPECIES: RseA family anti-sigma factor [Shewanella]QFU21698.1 anti-sigma factor [Shewanella sp. YLB-09]QPG56988.1 anti-sigma factor [Shewanella eurypsychrophilus]